MAAVLLDPQLEHTKPFSLINSFEILIMSGSIFHLIDIHFNNDQLWIIRIKLCSINNENLKSIFDYVFKHVMMWEEFFFEYNGVRKLFTR